MTDMDAGAKAWLAITAKEHYWRVADWMEIDDLIQDGNMCWQRIVAKYEDRDYTTITGVVTKGTPRVRSRRHLMGLFKISYLNHINNLSKTATRCRVEVRAYDLVKSLGSEDLVWDQLQIGGRIEEQELQDFERLVAEAPSSLQTIFRTLMAMDARRTFSAAYRVYRNHRETLNERLCRVAGLDATGIDLVGQLRAYLNHDKPHAA